MIDIDELNFEPHSFTVLRHTPPPIMWGCASAIMHGALHQNLTCIFSMQEHKKRKTNLDILADRDYFINNYFIASKETDKI